MSLWKFWRDHRVQVTSLVFMCRRRSHAEQRKCIFLFTVIYLVIWSVIPDHYLLYTCLFFCLFRKPQSLEFMFCLQCHKMYFIGGFIKVLIGKVSLHECTDVLQGVNKARLSVVLLSSYGCISHKWKVTHFPSKTRNMLYLEKRSEHWNIHVCFYFLYLLNMPNEKNST